MSSSAVPRIHQWVSGSSFLFSFLPESGALLFAADVVATGGNPAMNASQLQADGDLYLSRFLDNLEVWSNETECRESSCQVTEDNIKTREVVKQ